MSLGEIIGIDFGPYPNGHRWLDRMKELPNRAKVNEAFYDLRDAMKDPSSVTLA